MDNLSFPRLIGSLELSSPFSDLEKSLKGQRALQYLSISQDLSLFSLVMLQKMRRRRCQAQDPSPPKPLKVKYTSVEMSTLRVIREKSSRYDRLANSVAATSSLHLQVRVSFTVLLHI